jgi:hypothetical protein
MAVTGEIKIRVTSEDKASAKLAKVKAATKKLGDEAKESKGKLQSLQGGLQAMQAALVAAGGIALLNAIGNLVELGVKAQRAETALRAFTGSAQAAAQTVEAVQAAAGGAVNRVDSMTTATRLFSMGLASTAEEAAKFTEIAVTLGATMGKGPQEAIENFTLMLANQSILRLDTYGISGARVRERMKELQTETKGLTREQAFLTAVLEQGNDKLARLGAEGFQAASSLDVLKVRIEDMKTSVGTWLAEGLLPWLDGIRAVNDANKAAHQNLVMTTDGYAAYVTAVEMARAAGSMLSPALDEAGWSAVRNAEIMASQAGVVERFEGSLRGVSSAAGSAKDEVAGLAVATGDLTRAQLGADAMRNLDQALTEGKISQKDYDRAAKVVMQSFLEMPRDMIEAQFALRDLNSSFQAGTTDIGGYVGGVADLANELEGLPTSKTVTVTVQYETKGGPPEFQHGGQFMVGGQSGVDKNLVVFKATKGEMVTVTPPGVTNNTRNLNIGSVNTPMDRNAFRSMAQDWMSGRL